MGWIGLSGWVKNFPLLMNRVGVAPIAKSVLKYINITSIAYLHCLTRHACRAAAAVIRHKTAIDMYRDKHTTTQTQRKTLQGTDGANRINDVHESVTST